MRIKTDSGIEKDYSVSEVEISIKSQAKSVAGIADGLSSLAIGQGEFEIYEMDWRTKIHLQEGGARSESETTGQATVKNVRLFNIQC